MVAGITATALGNRVRVLFESRAPAHTARGGGVTGPLFAPLGCYTPYVKDSTPHSQLKLYPAGMVRPSRVRAKGGDRMPQEELHEE